MEGVNVRFGWTRDYEDEDRPVYPADLLEVPEEVERWLVIARAILFALFFLWGWSLFRLDIRTGAINASFMHLINLVFHEAGHVIFRLFGEFMGFAGGTLAQLLMPVIVGGAFHWTHRDNFGASIALWWLSVSVMDCAPYIYDALDPKLELLGGGTGKENEGHDWIYMLGELHLIQSSHGIGRAVHAIGAILMLVANAWGLLVLMRQWNNRTES
jgi:hypothetical protein